MNVNAYPMPASPKVNTPVEQISQFIYRHGNKILLYLLLTALSIPFLFPFWWMFTSAFKPSNDIFAYPLTLLPQTWRLENFVEVFTFQPFARHYFNSIYIAVLVTVGTLLVASLSGYAFARIRFRGSSVLFLLLLSALMMPAEVTIIPNYTFMQSLRLTDSHIPLIILPILGANSIVSSFLMRQYFLGIPQELEEAGLLDGLSRWGIFWRIALPIAKPALIAVTILTFLYSWNSFLEPLVFITNPDLYTLPLSLRSITDEYGQAVWNIQLAATALTVLPVILIYAVAQRHVVESFALSGSKG